MEIKPSSLSNAQVKDLATAAANAAEEHTGDKTDADGDNNTNADAVSTNTTAGLDAGPAGADAAVATPDAVASDAGSHCQIWKGGCIGVSDMARVRPSWEVIVRVIMASLQCGDTVKIGRPCYYFLKFIIRSVVKE